MPFVRTAAASPRNDPILSPRRRRRRSALQWFGGALVCTVIGWNWSDWMWSAEFYQHEPALAMDLSSIHLLSAASSYNNNNNNSSRRIQRRSTETNDKRTLALMYPPGIVGGYRNQVLRFIALLDYGIKREVEQLLLPSLLWSTRIDGESRPIPMDWVFDIEYWNSFDLPKIVSTVDGVSDCWMTGGELERKFIGSSSTTSSVDQLDSLHQSLLQGGTIRALAHVTLPLLTEPIEDSMALRKTDYWPTVSNCTNPLIYGGGTKAGRLWNHYLRISKEANRSSWWGDVYRAIRPAPRWRRLVEQECFRPNFLALHARVEVEMMQHVCGIDMERNLTSIVQLVRNSFGTDRDILVAVNRAGMETDHVDYVEISQSNIRFLNEAVQQGHVFECGARVLDTYYSDHPDVPDHGALLESVINFHAAVSATTFVGVQGSSYSNDVWTTRYYMGKGDQNFRYTNRGTIVPVQGLPQAHSNCKRRKEKIKSK